MDFEVAFAKLQLGDRISFGDGEPKPPEAHARKLRAWHQANGTGILTRKVHDEKGAPSRLEVRISPMEDVCVSMTLIITADSRSANRIELISSPKPGGLARHGSLQCTPGSRTSLRWAGRRKGEKALGSQHLDGTSCCLLRICASAGAPAATRPGH